MSQCWQEWESLGNPQGDLLRKWSVESSSWERISDETLCVFKFLRESSPPGREKKGEIWVPKVTKDCLNVLPPALGEVAVLKNSSSKCLFSDLRGQCRSTSCGPISVVGQPPEPPSGQLKVSAGETLPPHHPAFLMSLSISGSLTTGLPQPRSLLSVLLIKCCC